MTDTEREGLEASRASPICGGPSDLRGGEAEPSGPKWTPGPWLYEYDRADEQWAIWTRQPHTGCIAAVFPEDVNGDFPAEANARLIAAAPDLYEALADMLAGWRYIREHHGDLYGVGWSRCEASARAALAKARGQ
jgi:hypothetical protein